MKENSIVLGMPALALVFGLCLAGCPNETTDGGKLSGETPAENNKEETPVNHPPVIILSVEQGELKPGGFFILNAIGSDADGDSLSYYWNINGFLYPYEDSLGLIGFYLPSDGGYFLSVSATDGKAEAETIRTFSIPNPNTDDYKKAKAMLGEWTLGQGFKVYNFTYLSNFPSETIQWVAFTTESNIIAEKYDSDSADAPMYFFLDTSGDIYNLAAVFDMSSSGRTIAGDVYYINKDTDVWSSPMSFTGTKTASFKNAPLSFVIPRGANTKRIEWTPLFSAKSGVSENRSLRLTGPDSGGGVPPAFDYAPTEEERRNYRELREIIEDQGRRKW
ncbi:MAG: hypothetical protein LBU18_00125 [Treponema sp.]|jgi:hypothetical protein|nr:hypothetical protein [Treponema sp.]